MAIAYVKKEDIVLNFENGFAMTEMLAGAYTYPPVRNFRGVVKAGCCAQPPMHEGCLQVYCLTDGRGYVTTQDKVFTVEELSFFVPAVGVPFTIHALTEMTFTAFIIKMGERDWAVHNRSRLVLPFFRKVSDSEEYWQSCKTEGTRSWSIINGKQLFPVIMGVVKSGEGGTIEKGHPSVAQWNVILGDSDIDLTIDGEGTVEQKGGDFSYVPAGPDHSLVARPGKTLHYIWFEYFV